MGPTPPAADIWWSSLETCSNLVVWGFAPIPSVLTSSGGHRNTYGWQAKSTIPTGMLSRSTAFALVSNFKNGFYCNKWWCSHLTFAISRIGQQRSKKNENADVTCESTLTYSVMIVLNELVVSEVSCYGEFCGGEFVTSSAVFRFRCEAEMRFQVEDSSCEAFTNNPTGSVSELNLVLWHLTMSGASWTSVQTQRLYCK